MKWELSKSEFKVIGDVINAKLYGFWDDSIEDQLYRCLITKLSLKFYQKAAIVKSWYQFKVENAEALCFLLITCHHTYPNESYEGNCINRLNAQIHQQCFVTNLNNNNNKQLNHEC